MPVGTSFENSSMKTCFSLSSLQAPETTPEKGVKPRQFNSLTKKRVKATAVRRSWGSASEQRDDFWSGALQANYDYIMDTQLIDKCEEADRDLNFDRSGWSITELTYRFSELYLWLNSVQEMIYGREENVGDKNLRLQCQSMVLEKSPSLHVFNDQASQLVQLCPELQEEVAWRVDYLNSKWDTILSILGPSDCGKCEQETCIDIDHEIKCLRKWFKVMEESIHPLDFRTKYTKTELEHKASELRVLHQDIENQGKIVGSVVKLCKRADASCGTTTANVRRIGNGLERRWHLLFLRSLEWKYYLEAKHENTNQSYSDDSESDYYQEPVRKHPRLSKETHMLEDKNDKQSLAAETLEPKPVMNTDVLQQTTFDVVDGEKRFVFGEDTSQFTQSNRLAKNLGTYYFKHEDTDSDMDKIVQSLSKNESTTQEETSEDEWTYTKPDQDVISPVLKPKAIPEETIKLLVQKAEELVHQETKGTRMSRVKQWLSMDKPEESCDASCEDDETSQTSDELNESSATFKATSRNTSVLDLITPEDTPKVQLRQRKHNGSRPWSVSCIMQLETPTKTNYSMLSTSESALHCMSSTPKKLSTGSQYNTTSTLNNGNHSTSSTLEESSNVLQEEKSSPCRRRKLKMRRKCSNKTHNNKTNQRLFKSSSYSGATSAFTGGVNERQTSSDPPATSIFNCQKCETTSGAETDDSFNKRVPQFKIGSQTSYLTDVSDSNPGKSLNTTEEQSSSMSEQAWDSYQEKYLSEAYSEAHDSDAARRLLEFGEDYRNFIDSQSDWSKNSDFSPTYRRRTLKVPNHVPESLSDSDTESLAHLINTSRDQLVYTQEIYKQQVNLGLGQYLATNEIGEMVSTSDRHIDILQHIERSFENCAISREDKKAATELLEKWRQFKKSVLKMQDYRNLQKEILQMKHTLGTFKIPESDSLIEMAYIDDLEKDVAKYEQILSNIKDYKEKLLELNVAVHHFVVENKEYNSSSLKNDIAQLYCLWEELHSQAIERIARLKPLLDTWRTLEMRLDQLHGDLQSDEKTLKLIDNAVEGSGALSEQTATYVREVAKLLSETNHSMQGCTLPELFTEGSLSDSGISDEGSEHELGERERRLAAIRRLVRQLEVNISPDSDARIRMTERLNAAEEELKSLQKKCRSLIVRSAACHVPAEFREADKEPQVKPKDDGGEPDREPSSSWFRRAVRASVPFQLVLVTILCIAWLLEPQCCDNMNNYAWSLSPQLRYINGPPPT